MPVVFSMRLDGPGSDPEGRRFVVENASDRVGKLQPPDLFVLSPERELLGRLPYDASAEETIELLRRILAERPDLGPATDPAADLSYDLSDPAQAQLAELERQWDAGERASLAATLEAWLERYASQWDHGAATARVMLGGAKYHQGDYEGADAIWREVMERHPTHPYRHRAKHNLLDAIAWRMQPHPDIAGARHPRPGDKPVVIPQPDVLEKNLRHVASSARYRKMPSGLPLVEIPSGTFTMGGQPAMFPRELPLRRVTISRPFLLSAWPITVGLWRRFRPDDFPVPKDPAALDLPLLRVTHEQALEFCDFLSSIDGVSYRLATEAEWEYAARGGLEGADYPWGNQVPDETMCNYLHSAGVPVASYPANGYGLFDMAGNCQEWVADRYLETAYRLTPPEVVDPTGPTEADGSKNIVDGGHVLRGGYIGVPFSAIMVRNAHRLTNDLAGFRVAANLDRVG